MSVHGLKISPWLTGLIEIHEHLKIAEEKRRLRLEAGASRPHCGFSLKLSPVFLEDGSGTHVRATNAC
jgi:hypothetical protein